VLAQSAESSKSGDAKSVPEHETELGTLARKLNNPLSDVWAMQVEFQWNQLKGDLTRSGTHKNGYTLLFQPVLPIPLTEHWKLITRPVIPLVSTSLPESSWNRIDFDRETGLGDIELPLVFTKRSKSNFVIGFGPTFTFPTASSYELGAGKFEMGPAVALTYKTKDISMGVFPQYWWSVAGDGSSRPHTSHLALLYYFWYMLPKHWQVGISTTASFDNEATSGNKWNIPLGLSVGKMLKLGKIPVKIQSGLYYSVEHQDDYGQRWQFKIDITPVIPSLIKKPLF
jgi:hypothetical protein